ncbi:MAG: flagellar basal-body rod protein FlgG [bacterium]|nr:flagellar basal-body rod protein FlgG [bacterium]
MLRALYAAATGMEAQEKCLSIIANNLANVNTTAFKSQRASFEDLFYETYKKQDTEEPPAPIQIGHGTKLSSTSKSFTQGEVQETQAPLDLMIKGDGFFKLTLPDGSYAYTRNGSFKLTGEGEIVDAHGYKLDPEITVPENTTNIVISEDGKVSATVTGDTVPEEVGEITLSKFINPTGLESIGENLYKPTVNSGEAIDGVAGFDGFGSIDQGYLEMANVNVMDQMVQMILVQRAYELNSKVISTGDQMYAIANKIR